MISTHDHRLIEKGDRVIEISNHQLNVLKEKENESFEKKSRDHKFDLSGLDVFWRLLSKHHKTYSRLLNIFVAFGITIALGGIEFGYLVQQRFKTEKVDQESNVIIVGKKNYEDEVFDFVNIGLSFPFDEKEYAYINNLEHIKKIDPFFDFYTMEQSVITDHNFILKDSKDYEIVGIHQYNISLKTKKETKVFEYKDNIITDTDWDDAINDPDDISGLNFATYPNDIDYHEYIDEEWNEEGLYVSQYFYQKHIQPMIQTEEDKKDIRIRFPLYVPIYNVNGLAHVDQDHYAKANSFAGKIIYEEFKIKGVMKYSTIVDLSIRSSHQEAGEIVSFALSSDEFQKYLDQYATKEHHVCFVYEKSFESSCDIEPDKSKEIRYFASYEPYRMNTAAVVVDDVKNVAAVKKQLEDYGFYAFNKFVDVNAYIEAENSVRSIVMIVSCITFLLIVLMNVLLKLNNKQDESSFQQFFKEKGFTKKMINKINKQRFKYQCFSVGTMVIVQFILLNLLLRLTLKIDVIGNYQNLLLGIVFVIICEYFIPLCLESYYAKGVKENVKR